MSATAQQTEVIPFIGKTNTTTVGEKNISVQCCIAWLLAKNLITSHEPNRLPYAPDKGVRFRVLHPLESCGNEDENSLLPTGTWVCVKKINRDAFTAPGQWAEFINEHNGVKINLRVGCNPDDTHAIMAWKNNIELVS